MGARSIHRAAAERLLSLTQYARTHSPYFARHLRRLAPVPALSDIPVSHKAVLMENFDDWLTDRSLCRADIQRFLDHSRGTPGLYREQYGVWCSSGSSGERGIFVQDHAALVTYDALLGYQFSASALALAYRAGFAGASARSALIAVTDGPFASVWNWQRWSKLNPWAKTRAFSIVRPIAELEAELNQYQPTFLASYPSMLTLLAEGQRAGRLHLAPLVLWSGGEHLSLPRQRAIEEAFACPVINEYGTSECLSIAFGCREGWLHVNEDWVILEAVDEHFEPVPPGTPSATTLLTNLANRVQPVIRYDLGDRITVRPDPCPCGSRLRALRVEGRTDEVLTFANRSGKPVSLAPMALTTLVEEQAGLALFQIEQRGVDQLVLRLDHSAPPDSVRRARAHLRRFLDLQQLTNVCVHVEHALLHPAARNGKLRQVIRGA